MRRDAVHARDHGRMDVGMAHKAQELHGHGHGAPVPGGTSVVVIGEAPTEALEIREDERGPPLGVLRVQPKLLQIVPVRRWRAGGQQQSQGPSNTCALATREHMRTWTWRMREDMVMGMDMDMKVPELRSAHDSNPAVARAHSRL